MLKITLLGGDTVVISIYEPAAVRRQRLIVCIGAVNMDDIGAVRKRSRSIGLIAIREVSPPFDEEQQY